MEKINIFIKKTLFFDAKNGFAIMIAQKQSDWDKKSKKNLYKDSDDFTVKGNITFGQKIEDISVSVEGEWVDNKKYGKSFDFTSIKLLTNSPTKMFLDKFVKGIRTSTLDEIFKKYSDDEVVEILDHTPEKLLVFKGIKEATLKTVISSWEEHRKFKKLNDIVAGFNFSKSMLEKIAQTLTPDEVKRLNVNPYLLLKVDGIGFKRADSFAKTINISPLSSVRLVHAVKHVIDVMTERGDSLLVKQDVLTNLQTVTSYEDQCSRTVFVDIKHLEAIYNKLIEMNKISEQEDYVTSSEVKNIESFIVENIDKRKSLSKNTIMKKTKLEKWIQERESFYKISLAKDQKKALDIINSGVNIFALSGYAGTGKSTVSQLVVELLEFKGGFFNKNDIEKDDVICCALSGIATDRIRNSTKRESITIASLLIRFEMGDPKVKKKKVFLIDESSMINSNLMSQLLKNIPLHAKVIFVGDPAQLPPIGSGAPFSDIVKLSLVEGVELTKIYRQSEDAVITVFANEIRKAIVPEKIDEKYDDFEWVDRTIPNIENIQKDFNNGLVDRYWFDSMKKQNRTAIQHSIATIAQTEIFRMRESLMNRNWLEYIKSFQIVSPLKKGEVGVNELNLICQSINTESSFKKKQLAGKKEKMFSMGSFKLYRFDKVVHIKNKNMIYLTNEETHAGIDKIDDFKGQEYRVNNGMIGLVSYITKKYVYVYFPVEKIHVRYRNFETVEYLNLGYALTIHKTQGAEFNNVLIPLVESHKIMLNNQLLYTGVTRAKNHLRLIGERNALEYACTNKTGGERKTYIQYLFNLKTTT